jgi:hypothetical protein
MGVHVNGLGLAHEIVEHVVEEQDAPAFQLGSDVLGCCSQRLPIVRCVG